VKRGKSPSQSALLRTARINANRGFQIQSRQLPEIEIEIENEIHWLRMRMGGKRAGGPGDAGGAEGGFGRGEAGQRLLAPGPEGLQIAGRGPAFLVAPVDRTLWKSSLL